MWRIKYQPSNSTSCSDNYLRLLVLVVGELYWRLQVMSSFSISGGALPLVFCIHVRSGPIYWEVIYLAKTIIRWWYFTCKEPETIICDGILHVNIFHYFKIPYITCIYFLHNLLTMSILDLIFLSHVVSKKIATPPPPLTFQFGVVFWNMVVIHKIWACYIIHNAIYEFWPRAMINIKYYAHCSLCLEYMCFNQVFNWELLCWNLGLSRHLSHEKLHIESLFGTVE